MHYFLSHSKASFFRIISSGSLISMFSKNLYTSSMIEALLLALLVLCSTTVAEKELLVNITVLHSASNDGAVCLDGSPPAYHLDSGYGSGLRNWIIFVDGGGWCINTADCKTRSAQDLGSSKMMKPQVAFSGIIHNDSQINPDFYNWNRVKVRYCDQSSFTGDVEDVDPDTKLHYRGARIFKAIMDDLLVKGMQEAENAILCGTSAGGLATMLNCDKFKSFLPNDARVKCVADAGFFINAKTISGSSEIQGIYERVVTLHGSAKNLPPSCTSVMKPSLCFFPQNAVPHVQTPLFIINSAYDTWQINNTLVPEDVDPQRAWEYCKARISNCTYSQRIIIQAFGVEFLKAFVGLTPSFTRGYFITSCHSHGQIQKTWYWLDAKSPRIFNKTIAEAVADWYFERAVINQLLDPYPCARDCWT